MDYGGSYSQSVSPSGSPENGGSAAKFAWLMLNGSPSPRALSHISDDDWKIVMNLKGVVNSFLPFQRRETRYITTDIDIGGGRSFGC